VGYSLIECQGPPRGQGSWEVTLTEIEPAVGGAHAVHGSLVASLIAPPNADAGAPSVDLALTF
jgi:hypothetical protein